MRNKLDYFCESLIDMWYVRPFLFWLTLILGSVLLFTLVYLSF